MPTDFCTLFSKAVQRKKVVGIQREEPSRRQRECGGEETGDPEHGVGGTGAGRRLGEKLPG